MKVLVYANKQLYIHRRVETIEKSLDGTIVIWLTSGNSYEYDKVTKIIVEEE